MIIFEGSKNFRQRLVLSLLTGKAIKFSEFHSQGDIVGIRDFELRFLKLIQGISNGTSVEINFSGTEIIFKPGIIFGGEYMGECGGDRCVSYYLEPLLILAPFSKTAFRITLNGITSNKIDKSIDSVKNCGLKMLEWFGVKEGVDLKINKRSFDSKSSGSVYFTCPVVEQLQSVNLNDIGKVSKIRGIVVLSALSPHIGTRAMHTLKSKLSPFIPDVYIYIDRVKREESFLSSGYSIYLQAESTTNAIYTAEIIGEPAKTVEEVSEKCCLDFLKRIFIGGICDQDHQWLLLFLMALCDRDASVVLLGPLSDAAKELITDIESFMEVKYKVKNTTGQNYKVSCIGSGIKNLFRRTN